MWKGLRGNESGAAEYLGGMASETETSMDEIKTVHPTCDDANGFPPVLSKLELAERVANVATSPAPFQTARELIKRLSNTDTCVWADSREPVMKAWR